MSEIPSWVAALAGAAAAALVTWGALREKLRRQDEDIRALQATTTANSIAIAHLQGAQSAQEKETP